VGVSADAIWPRPLPGRGTQPGDYRGLPLGKVLQWGELTLRFVGTLSDSDLGRICYCVDDETVTTDPSELIARYAVGRLVRRSLTPTSGGLPLVRVLISGFPCCCGDERVRFCLDPHTLDGLEPGKNYRVGVTLPFEFGDECFAAELMCGKEKIVINRDTARKTLGYCGWNIYLPADTPTNAYYAPGDLKVTACFAGYGWTGPRVGLGALGVWDEVKEIL
jgi:hypothetical protein